MRVTTNTRMIKRRAKFGTYASLGGIAVLAGGMVASFQPQLVWVSLLALIAGFLLAQYGNYNLRRYGRSPRPDEIVAESLKGFDDRYHLYAWSLPSPFVLLTPHGLYSFVTRDQNGEITNNGSQWKTKFSIGRALLMFSQEGLGNPSQDAQQHAAKLTEWVRSKLPESEITAQPAILFTDPRAQLNVTDPAVPVLDTKGVKKWLRSGKPEFIKNAELRQLEALFDEAAALTQTGGK
jgi:hypothetical protein